MYCVLMVMYDDLPGNSVTNDGSALGLSMQALEEKMSNTAEVNSADSSAVTL